MKGFALGLALKQRRNATRKSPIYLCHPLPSPPLPCLTHTLKCEKDKHKVKNEMLCSSPAFLAMPHDVILQVPECFANVDTSPEKLD